MAKVEIVAERCKSCGYCVKFCPKQVRKHRGNGSLDIKEHPLLLAFAQSSGCSIFLSSCQVAYGLPRLDWL